MISAKRHIGDIGEGVACKYLENRGYRVIQRNYWKPWGEVDIVAEKGNILSFVEVKSISRETSALYKSQEGIHPAENMHSAKLKRLHRAIQTYLLDHKVPEDKAWQIDLACVFLDLSARKAKVELMENVF